ncbi:MAG TPA: DUF748 domain-containing protein [Candidatus Limnocylindria bacterium]|nr:DUF748 domain-containing protein [Candidatus Limnocylindria bacterium]
MTRRRLIVTIVVVGMLLVSATAAWLALPGLVRRVVVWQVETQTGRTLTMREFDLDLRAGRLRIAGLRLADREPGPPLAELDRLEARFRPGALLRGHLWIEDLALDNPRVRIVRTGGGVLNVSDLLRPSEPRAQAAAVTLDRFALIGGAILFEDRTLTPPRTWRADALTIEAALLSTVNPEPRGRGRLTTTVAGAALTVEMSEVRLAPMHGRVRVSLRDMDATLANLYRPPDATLVLERAVVSAGLTATADAQDGLRLDGQARLDNLVMRRRGADASLVTVPSLTFAFTTADGPDGRPRGRVEVTGRATVHDPRPGQTHRFELERLKLVVDGLDASGRAPARVALTAALPGGGALDVQGTARATPLGAELRTRISRVDLAFWAPYLDLPLQFNGMIETDLAVDVAAGAGVTTRVRGRATLDGATIYGPRAGDGAPPPGGPSEGRTREGRRRLLAADRMELTGLDAQWPRVRVERLRLARPRVTIERDRAGRFPIADVVRSLRPAATPPPSAAAAKPATATTGALALEIGEVAVEAGRVRVDDASVTPPARLRVGPIALTANDVTWPGRQPARVRFSAGAPEAGTFEAEGTVALDPVRFELRARVAGVTLAPYRPYVPLTARLQGRLEADMALRGQLGETIELNARGTAALSDLSFSDGDRPVLTVGRIETVGLDYTWPATASIERAHMKKSWVHIERRADGTLPIAALFGPVRPAPGPAAPAPPAPSTPPAPSAPPAAAAPGPATVAVREAVFEDGSATIVDAAVSPAARLEVTGMRLAAQDFHWPARGAIPVQLDLSTPGAGTLAAKGQLDLTARTLEAQVTPSGMDLSPVRPYLPVRGRIAGTASGNLQVKATLDPLTITARGAATLADLAIADGDRPVATAARLETTGIDYTWPATMVVEIARLQKPWAQIERAADGSFPITALLTPAPPSAPPAPGGRAPKVTVDVRVRRAAVEGGVIAIVDGALTPPGRIQLKGASLHIENLGWPAREASQVTLRTETATGGHLEAQGQLRVDARAVDMQVAATQLDLATMQAFLPSRGTIEGKMDADLRVRGTLAPLAVAVTGRLAFDDPTFGDGQRMLAYIKRVDVARLDADWPRRVTAERVTLDRPWVLLEREEDGTVPLLGLLMAGRSAPNAAPAPPAAPGAGDRVTTAPVVTVGAFAVEEGFVRFVDRTTTPAFAEEASRIALTGRGLGTAPDSRGQVAMNGRLTGGAPFEIKGTLGALGGPLNLELDGKLTDFPLTRVNPYSNKLIGWIARRGAFGATVRYRVTDNRIEATNDLLIGQPEYAPSRRGDEVRERVGVPFGMLVSLLKNARGEIRLSVPVSGDLASRQLDLSDAFWAAMRETAISVLALPVSWVGKIFYTEDARIETVRIWPVYFEAGSTSFTRGFDRHAERLATFLRDAPGVTLAMKAVHTVEDIVALKREAVRQRIDAAAREPGQTPEGVAARLFADRFPDQAPPPGLEALVTELVRAEPNPDAAARDLAARRMDTTRARLEAAKGAANAERLRVTEGVVPVEASGQGRIEFEIVP